MANHPKHFFRQLQEICLDAGVKVVHTPCIKKAPINGSTRWLNDTPLIQLTGRYKRNDIFWFTFFHEAAHILLHADSKTDIFLDDPNHGTTDSVQEHEANQWASDQLIPPAFAFEFSRLEPTASQITAFAKNINIHPGIVVGRLQHEGRLGYATQLNRLKVSFRFVEEGE